MILKYMTKGHCLLPIMIAKCVTKEVACMILKCIREGVCLHDCQMCDRRMLFV